MTDFAILSQNVGAELRLRQSDCDVRSENKILSWWDWKCYLSEFERVWIAICCYLLPAPAPSSGGSVQVLSVRPSSPLAAVNTFQILSFHWVISARNPVLTLPICIIHCMQGWSRMCCLSLTGKSVIWIYLSASEQQIQTRTIHFHFKTFISHQLTLSDDNPQPSPLT